LADIAIAFLENDFNIASVAVPASSGCAECKECFTGRRFTSCLEQATSRSDNASKWSESGNNGDDCGCGGNWALR